jgi:hypothetical protein
VKHRVSETAELYIFRGRFAKAAESNHEIVRGMAGDFSNSRRHVICLCFPSGAAIGHRLIIDKLRLKVVFRADRKLRVTRY